VELPAFEVAHIAELRVGDDLSDAAAQRGARHWQRPAAGQIDYGPGKPWNFANPETTLRPYGLLACASALFA
jgi:hypothetical protein